MPVLTCHGVILGAAGDSERSKVSGQSLQLGRAAGDWIEP